MKQIELTQGQVALVDDEDFERINAHKWYAHKDNKTGRLYAARGNWLTHRLTMMHREIIGAPRGFEVDHVRSNDALDNRKSNLRLCTHADNQHNRGKQKDNTSGHKGVSWYPPNRKWRAQIGFNGKVIHLGYHDTAEDAARAYNEAAKKYHGEFARLNEV